MRIKLYKRLNETFKWFKKISPNKNHDLYFQKMLNKQNQSQTLKHSTLTILI